MIPGLTSSASTARRRGEGGTRERRNAPAPRLFAKFDRENRKALGGIGRSRAREGRGWRRKLVPRGAQDQYLSCANKSELGRPAGREANRAARMCGAITHGATTRRARGCNVQCHRYRRAADVTGTHVCTHARSAAAIRDRPTDRVG